MADGAVHTPAVGDEVVPGQSLGAIPGDIPSDISTAKWHKVAIIDVETRRIVRQASTRSHHPLATNPPHIAQPGEKMIYWGVASLDSPIWGGHYLPYAPLDGVAIPSSPDPVNALPDGRTWRNLLSRFAHDLMSFNPQSNHLRDAGTHTTGHLPPTDAAAQLKNKATYQLGRAVIGVAFHRVGRWMTLDAQRLAQYPASVPDAENWKIWRDGTIPVALTEIPIPNMGDMMAALCGDEIKHEAGLCVGAWVYLLNERIDASSYDANMNSGGEIRLPDPAWDLWRPRLFLHRVTGTRSEKADQWSDIMGWFTAAHDHYLTSVAPTTVHSR